MQLVLFKHRYVLNGSPKDLSSLTLQPSRLLFQVTVKSWELIVILSAKYALTRE
jgi:hypothetical protein